MKMEINTFGNGCTEDNFKIKIIFNEVNVESQI